ncbi:hypothetical protein JCM30237_26650 [Halolamina litorea]|uniref:DUF7544 domain-containing protein n=1 Tax=Halolamina litorea TaxID=1515593 RepID=UPI00227025C3|nr:hypothetical protein [Halolamina litorea]
MSWHAVRAVVGAAATARGFLLPERGRWLRLSLLSLVVGVGWLSPAAARVTVPAAVGDRGLPMALAAGLFVLGAVVADGYGRFALVSGLRSDRLRLSEDVRWRLGRSVRWLCFAFAALVLVSAAAGVTLRAAHDGWLAITGGTMAGPADIAVTAVTGLVVASVCVGILGVVHATHSLLPATMLATGVGAMASWRRLWRAFEGRRGGFVGYLLTRGLVAAAVLTLALVAAGTVVTGLALAGFVTLVALFGTVSAGVETVGVVRFGVACTLVGFLAVLPVRAATVVYLASYDLTVLGTTDADLDVIGVAGTEQPPDDPVSVVLPDGTEAGTGGLDPAAGATDGGLTAADAPAEAGDGAPPVDSDAAPRDEAGDGDGSEPETGGFQFDTVEN